MPGRLIDLSSSLSELPERLIVDANIIEWLRFVLSPFSIEPQPARTLAQSRASHFIANLRRRRVVGLVTSTGFDEVCHALLKARFRQALPDYQPDLSARFPNVRRHDWHHLYKARGDLVSLFVSDLHKARDLMRSNGLFVLQPDDLSPIASGRTWDEELIWTIDRYQLDSSDAAILVDARRAGVASIASTDPDLRRAQLDFDVYTRL